MMDQFSSAVHGAALLLQIVWPTALSQGLRCSPANAVEIVRYMDGQTHP